jgi:hypothetical protein
MTRELELLVAKIPMAKVNIGLRQAEGLRP